ncbi:MAG: branched-chain amino acid ABC transporter permease [Ottowia sp.]|uniref:branched-chain amino acid ABC transporter permease n=1 Tax=unclassified Ottowia TaxID=2645081 RepID=UPI003C2BF2CC
MVELIAQQFVNGLSAGMAYALVALGLTLIFGVLHVINFSHGEFYMLGALVVVVGMQALGAPYLVMLLAAPVLMAAVGLLIERVSVGPLLSRSDGLSDALLATYAVSLLLADAVLAVRGPAPAGVGGFEGAQEVFGVVLSHQRIFVFVVGLLLIAVLEAMLRRSRFGKQMRAVAQNRFAAQVVGIDVRGVGMRTFMLGAAIAGLAGALLVPIAQFTPYMGHNVVIKAFVVVVIGGMGSVAGAVVCGLGLGVAEALVGLALSDGFTTALVYALLLVTLMVRPQGMFGKAAR